MIERLEGTLRGYQDVELYYQLWRPGEDENIGSSRGHSPSAATIVVTHGIAEHSDCYERFAEAVTKQGYTVFAWDLRGHGHSDGKRGYVNRFEDFSDDLEAVTRFVKSEFWDKNTPLFLFGHSMGGLITLKLLLDHSPSDFYGLILSSPALGLSLEVPKVKELAAHWLSEWLPKVTLYNEIKFDDLVRDQNLVRQYRADPLRHNRISPRLFLGLMQTMEEVKRDAGKIQMPTLMQLAGREKLVSTSVSEAFFENLGAKKKELYIYADSFHEIYNDLDRDDVFRDLFRFLEKSAREFKNGA